MPQSFGPFDFDSAQVIEYGKSVLEKCECIYAREESGYELLKSIGLKNIKRMSDSVLLEKNWNPSAVIKNYETYIETINTTGGHTMALVPNFRLVDRGGVDYEKMLAFYSDIVNTYADTYRFYLLAHAGEDLSICKNIKERFADSDRVIMIDHVMFSFNCEDFFEKMDFIVASRYHAIIHAYKKGVPAVVMGWADKYKGVLSELGQSDYLIDLDYYDKALATVDRMADSYKNESGKIKERVEEIQKHSCYDFLKELHASV